MTKTLALRDLVDPGTVPSVDRRGRPLRDLRISVIDRCNFRCTYCMPEAADSYLDTAARLSFDEIVRLARLFVESGVEKIRLTGGEPLLRPDLASLIERLKAIDGLREVALTTNGVLLADRANELRAAGLDRVTVSLDAVDPAVFARISGGREALPDVLHGIDVASRMFPAGTLKLNCVVIRGVNDAGVEDLVARFRGSGITLRFIEYMDVGNRNAWRDTQVVPSRQLRERIAARWPLAPLDARRAGEVARRYRFLDDGGEIGFISSVSEPFCGACNRARLSSDGKLFTCLFSTTGLDLRGPLRGGADDATMQSLILGTWRKRADAYSEQRAQPCAETGKARPKIEMHYIGG